jgi:hypothetical protein
LELPVFDRLFWWHKKSSTKKKGGIEFDVKILQLKNIRFNQIDKWVGKNMKLEVRKLDLLADDFNFDKKQINLNTLTLVGPRLYPGKLYR